MRMLLYLHFTSECHQNVCYFKCEHCAQAGFLGDQAASSSSDCWILLLHQKIAALSVSNELMLISGKAGGVIDFSLLNARIYPKKCAALSVSNLQLNYWGIKKLLQMFPKIECKYLSKRCQL